LEWGRGGTKSGWNKGDPGTGGDQQSVNRDMGKGTGPGRPGKRPGILGWDVGAWRKDGWLVKGTEDPTGVGERE